jgi:hypothetical protein
MYSPEVFFGGELSHTLRATAMAAAPADSAEQHKQNWRSVAEAPVPYA